MKLYWRIYLFLAATTLATLVLSIWVSFSVLPALFERQRSDTLDAFEERLASGHFTSREQIHSLADSMGVFLRFVRADHQGPPLQGQFPPPQAHRVPGDRDWTSVRVIPLPGQQFALLATARVRPPGFLLFALFALVLFLSQALALALGLRSVFTRTRLLTRATGEFGGGRLRSRYPDHGGKDEIDELGRAFNTMAERIVSLLDSHNELLNSVAHELRTPMARLGFALELARDDPGCASEKLELMEKDLYELDRLVSELLEFNRIGSSKPELEDVSLNEICREAAGVPGEIPVTVNEHPSQPMVAGDRRLLLRAVSNLVRNAVAHATSRVSIDVLSSGGRVSVRVTDDGPGFPPGLGNRAVNPFVKGENSGGSGLGLSIVKRIAEGHGGRLIIGASPGGGASVEIELPSDG